MSNIPEQFPLSWLKEQIDADGKFATEALMIRQRISNYQPEHIRETHSLASAAIGLINYWLVNRDLSGYVRGRAVDDFAALTVVEYDGSIEMGIANLESMIVIKRNDLLALMSREGMTLPHYLNGKPPEVRGRGGRPRVNDKKVEILLKLINGMIEGKNLGTGMLPGSAADLLAACKKIEKAKTDKSIKFGGLTTAAFHSLLRQTGYGVKVGRTPRNEATYWTSLCVEVVQKLPQDIFQ